MGIDSIAPHKGATEETKYRESDMKRENPELFAYFVRGIHALSERIASDANKLPSTEKSFLLMANYLANESVKLGIQLETEADVDSFLGNPMFQVGIAYAAMVRKNMEGGRSGE